jgi:hypothetical protein
VKATFLIAISFLKKFKRVNAGSTILLVRARRKGEPRRGGGKKAPSPRREGAGKL